MRRSVVLLVALALVPAGVGDRVAADAPTAAEEVTLTLLHPEVETSPAGAALSAALEAFAEEFPEITIEQNIVAILDLPEVYETAVLAGEPPDIVFVNLFGRPLQWLAEGATVPVTSLMEEWGLSEQVNELALVDWTHEDGELQGFPYFGFKWPVWYNNAQLTEAGVTELPTSTDDLIAATSALDEAGFGGIAVGGSDWSGNKLFWQILQAYLSNEAAIDMFRSGDFSGDEVRKGIDLFIALRDAGIFVESVEGLTCGHDDRPVLRRGCGDHAVRVVGVRGHTGGPHRVGGDRGFPEPLRRGVGQANCVRRVHELGVVAQS